MVVKVGEKQLKIIEPYVFENYITTLIIHCDQNFPHLKKTMGEEKLRQVLKDSVEKAEQSGFTQKGSVQFYIDMLVIFGWGFESDPQYPWLTELLDKNVHLSQIEQTVALYYAVEDYLDRISGEHSQYLFGAAEKLQQLSVDNMPVYSGNFTRDILNLLEDIYPQKYKATGEEALTDLILLAKQKSNLDYGFESAKHKALVVLLMYLLGSGFNHDPYYEWASATNINNYDQDNLLANHDEIARKLETRAKIWLKAAVKNEQLLLAQQDLMDGE